MVRNQVCGHKLRPPARLVKIAVFELLSGGGIQELVGIPTDNRHQNSDMAEAFKPLFREGWAMLSALAHDLQQCGHKVVTCLDFAIAPNEMDWIGKDLPFDVRTCSERHEWFSHWLFTALQADVTLVIAPEIGNILATTVSRLRAEGVHVLAPDPSFLEITSDKLLFSNAMRAAMVPHPSTQTLSCFLKVLSSAPKSNHQAFVLKRRDGAGCVEMKRFSSDQLLAQWCRSEPIVMDDQDAWIVQPWIEGEARSLVVVAGQPHLVLGAVSQRIQLGDDESHPTFSSVQYLGGCGPLSDVAMPHLELFAGRVLNAVSGTPRGWVGIDFLVPKGASCWSEWVPIEVNPRLTTSYNGYRQWYGAALGDILLGQPTDSLSRDYARFHSIDFH